MSDRPALLACALYLVQDGDLANELYAAMREEGKVALARVMTRLSRAVLQGRRPISPARKKSPPVLACDRGAAARPAGSFEWATRRDDWP